VAFELTTRRYQKTETYVEQNQKAFIQTTQSTGSTKIMVSRLERKLKHNPTEEQKSPEYLKTTSSLTERFLNDHQAIQQLKQTGFLALTYKPDKPLSCGAKVWIETTNDVTTFN
jgi:uncharacterized protein involved in exopolysaccharide biosynthesis